METGKSASKAFYLYVVMGAFLGSASALLRARKAALSASGEIPVFLRARHIYVCQPVDARAHSRRKRRVLSFEFNQQKPPNIKGLISFTQILVFFPLFQRDPVRYPEISKW